MFPLTLAEAIKIDTIKEVTVELDRFQQSQEDFNKQKLQGILGSISVSTCYIFTEIGPRINAYKIPLGTYYIYETPGK